MFTWCDTFFQEFNPMRFDPANKEDHAPHAFIPFSSGPRYSTVSSLNKPKST